MNISSPWLRAYLNGEISEPLVISTTGSSGSVKEITISAAALRASADAAHKFLNAKSGETWSLLLPTDHIAGINVMARSILLGTELKNISEKADYTSIVPTQLHNALNGDSQLLNHLKNCKAVLVGGARTPENLLTNAKKLGINVVTTYGATETCGGCVYDGIPLNGVEVEIENGKIKIRIASLNSGQWIETNDIGKLINGKLYVDGRADDVIISGGENISLVRLEKFLENKFPDSKFVAVGLADDKWGQALGLVCENEFPENLNSLIESELGKIYIPKALKIVSNIPTIGIGKYDRKATAALFLRNE